jgi:hypothetical protein
MKHYEPINDTELSFVKMINVGERIIVNNVRGYLQVCIGYSNDVLTKFLLSTLYFNFRVELCSI